MALPTTTDKPFDKALAEILAERELSGRELTRLIERHNKKPISRWAVVYSLKGEFKATVNTVTQVARALNIPPEHFAEYRLAMARDSLDPEVVGLSAALRNLERLSG